MDTTCRNPSHADLQAFTEPNPKQLQPGDYLDSVHRDPSSTSWPGAFRRNPIREAIPATVGAVNSTRSGSSTESSIRIQDAGAQQVQRRSGLVFQRQQGANGSQEKSGEGEPISESDLKGLLAAHHPLPGQKCFHALGGAEPPMALPSPLASPPLEPGAACAMLSAALRAGTMWNLGRLTAAFGQVYGVPPPPASQLFD